MVVVVGEGHVLPGLENALEIYKKDKSNRGIIS